jgi:hypothetical protein
LSSFSASLDQHFAEDLFEIKRVLCRGRADGGGRLRNEEDGTGRDIHGE